MANSNYFEFEDGGTDFPFYREDTENNKQNILIMLISTLLFSFLILGPIKFPRGQEQIILFLFTLLMLLFLTKADLSIFFKKPTVNNLRLIIVCFILYEMYYLMIFYLFKFIHYQTTPSMMDLDNFNLLVMFFYILQVIAEEIFKLLLFILVLHFAYKKTSNRKLSIIISSFVTMMVFGLLHINTFRNIPQIIMIQGCGSFFELFGYLKTKNVLIPIGVHLLINLSTWIPVLLGIY